MLYRTLGRTAELVSAIGLGGWHIGFASQRESSIATIRSAIDRGITFLDNSLVTTRDDPRSGWVRLAD